MPRLINGTAYEVSGNPNNPPIVLIHGLALGKFMWSEYASALSKDYFVVTYDLYGHCDSSVFIAPLSLSLLSGQLKNLLDELNIEQASIVGFSVGGMINRRFAMDYPERVSSLIILHSPHERSPDQQRRVEERAKLSANTDITTMLNSTLERWLTTDFLSNQSDLVDLVGKWLTSNDPTLLVQYRYLLASGVKELIRPNPPIQKPTLVVTAENDSGSTPEMSYAIAAEILGASTVIVPRLKHLAVLEDASIFINLIRDFLGRLE